MTGGHVLSTLLRFSLPIIFALFLQALYGAVDLMVVGRFAETADVSGVITGSMLIQTVTMVVTGFATGITVLVGEAIGKRDDRQASRTIGSGICIFAVAGLILAAGIAVSADVLATLLRAPADAFQQTSEYIFICGVGSVFVIAYNVLGAVFRGMGDSKTPLLTVAAACAINILGDLLLVAVFHLGAAGAALATIFSQATSVLLSLLVIRKRKLPFTFFWADVRFESAYMGKIVRLGSPIALQEALVGVSFLFIQMAVNSLGVQESAGFGVAEKATQFLMLLGSACMQALSAFVAQNIGAARPDRARKSLRQGVVISVSAGGVMGLLALFFGDSIAMMFSRDTAVIEQAYLYLKAYAPECVLMPFLFCFLGYFNGCEKTMFVMIQGLIGAFLVRIPIVLLVSRLEGTTLFHIGLSTPAASLVQSVIAVVFFLHLHRQGRRSERYILRGEHMN